MSGAQRSECVGLSACVKHGHVVPSKNCCWPVLGYVPPLKLQTSNTEWCPDAIHPISQSVGVSYSCILSTHYTHFLKYQLQIFSLSKLAYGLIKKLLLTSVYLCKMSDHLLTITSDCHGFRIIVFSFTLSTNRFPVTLQSSGLHRICL